MDTRENNTKNTIMGHDGFIGSEIAKRLKKYDTIPHKDSEIIYYFGSPSSIIDYNKNIGYCIKETVGAFMDLLELCKLNDIYLVYPSSATVNNKNNSYARCKAALEELHMAYDIPALGLRISAGYGVGEEHKGECASVIYQWCKQMKEGKKPIIYGNGTQTRDFIYITDVVDNIMELVKRKETGIVEIGTGINTSFNEIVILINKVLGTDITPLYIDTPKKYIQDTPVKEVPCKVSLEEGIRKIIDSL